MLPTIGRAILGGKNAIATVSRKNSYKVLKSEKSSCYGILVTKTIIEEKLRILGASYH